MVTIKKMTLTNFKGWASAEINFDGNADIKGVTGAGKTSFFDGWRWVLGFNVPDIEPVTKGNQQIPDLNTEVTVIVDVDGLEYNLRRTSTQNWKVDKVNQTRAFNGNTTTYYMDDFEVKANVYKEKITDLFGVSYDNLEMLVNLAYFNTNSGTKWTWKERRQFLFNACQVESILKSVLDKEEYGMIANDLKKGYSTIDITKQINTVKKGIADTKNKNEILLNAKGEELAGYSNLDFEAIQSDIDAKQKKIESLLSKKGKAAKADLNAEKIAELTRMKAESNRLEMDYAKRVGELAQKKTDMYTALTRLASEINKHKSDIESFTALLARTSDKKDDGTCPTCGQAWPAATLADMAQHTSEAIEQIKKDLKDAAEQAKSKSIRYNHMKADYDALPADIKRDAAQDEIKAKINDLEHEIYSAKVADVEDEITVQIEELKAEVATLQKSLAYKDLIKTIQASMEAIRMDSIEQTNKEVQNELRRQQLEKYVLETVGMVSDTINQYFEGVTFRLFDTLTANADKDLQEVCEVEYCGIGYGSLSNGQKIIANFYTVLGLQKIFNVNLPIFIDEAQSVTLDLESDKQVIRLVTAKGCAPAGTPINKLY